MNVFDLVATISLDSSKYESGLKSASSSTSTAGGKLSKTLTTASKVGASALGAITTALGVVGKKALEAGAEYETAFAQVETIMDKSQMSTEDMSSAIINLSNDMGVATSELTETVYNAISATGDTANAVSLAGTASKLATAGFTDTSSALSVLTTAMNAYGLSADDATSISDSLIQVQNLGVTTVAELSSSMGKAIASASAYGVDLGNLESAYVSITKAGIKTAEGTTYISSMLRELGDTGSDVSAVLQEETGKSFDELMNEGKSLGDVLGILSDSVDGDSTALKNLWSSAEAGNASSAIVGQGLEEFNDNLKQITETTGTTQTAFETMEETLSSRIEKVKNSWTNLLAGIGSEDADFDSLVSSFTDNFTNAVEALTPRIESAMQGIGELVVQLSPIIAEEIPTLIDTLLPSLVSSATTLIMELAKAMPSLLVTLVKSIGASLQTLLSTELASKLGSVFSVLAPMLASGFAIFGGGALAVLKLVSAFNAIKGVVSVAGTAIKGLFTVLSANPIGIIITLIVGLVAGFITLWNKSEAFRNFWINLWDTVSTAVSTAVSAISSFISSAWSNIQSVTSSTFNAVKNAIVNPIKQAKSTLSNIASAIKSMFSNLKITIPHVSLPHFSISPSGWKISDLLKGTIPTLSVKWYDKGGIFNSPSVIGVGEKRPEFVGALDDLREIVREESGGMTINVYPSEGMDEEALARKVVKIIKSDTKNRKAVYA